MMRHVNFETWFQATHPEITTHSIGAVLELTAQGATVPFIARYRKEKTGNINEVAIQDIIEGKERWDQLIKRQEFIIEEIDRQKKLTPELKERILTTYQPELLEDIYLPYKVKRKTKAAVAKDAGLEPLADWIWNCGHGTDEPQPGQTLEIWAFTFRNETKNIPDAETAIAGALDILVERISEFPELRQQVRNQFLEKGIVRTQKAKKAKPHSKFENYFEYSESIQSLLQPQNSHRYLAIRRGWMEDELTLTMGGPADDPEFENRLLSAFETMASPLPVSPGRDVLLKAAHLAYKQSVFTSIETELHKSLREVADDAAIKVFVENVKRLLMASPFGAKAVLGIDPGIKTGCKLAVVNDSGSYVASTVIHLKTEEEREKTKGLLTDIVKVGNISAIAIGNGTAGRETELFVRNTLKEQEINVPVVLVNEAGASVYSASEAAREEFPELDLTIRGAISIARRLQDPLAELVKIDPKSIGVGQYQHDISPNALKRSLAHVVESCVNQVGVNINTASYHLLSYVSGIGSVLAKSLVEYRAQKGLFKSRDELLQVPRFSKKTFEQAAGFLRIPNSSHPLDNTGVHPEHYGKLEAFAQKVGKNVGDLTGAGIQLLSEDPALREEIGTFTFDDIVNELKKPGRDPREEFVVFEFRDDIHEVKDLKPGMVCPGIVTNVTNFGAFVDIGVHQDGLVHISQISEKFIKDPKESVNPGDRVRVRVLEVNVEKNQISLSMKNTVERPKPNIVPVSSSANPSARPQVRPQRRPQPQGHGGNPREREIQRKEGTPGRVISPAGVNSSPRPAKKPKEAFNNPFGGLAALRSNLKPRS